MSRDPKPLSPEVRDLLTAVTEALQAEPLSDNAAVVCGALRAALNEALPASLADVTETIREMARGAP